MNVEDSSWEFLACVLTIGCCCLSQATPPQPPSQFIAFLCPGLPGVSPALWLLTQFLGLPSQIRHSKEQPRLFCFLSLGISFKVPPHGQRVLLVCLLLAFATPAGSPLHPHNLLLFSLVRCSPQSNSSPQASVASPPFQVQVGIFSSCCLSLKRCLFSFCSYH